MSEPETEIQNEESTPAQPTQPMKVISEAKRAQLVKARERAVQVKRERREERLRAQVAALDPPKSKEPITPMDPILVVEQSDSDEEQFEGPPGVLFVRRRRQKPPERSARDIALDQMYAGMFPI